MHYCYTTTPQLSLLNDSALAAGREQAGRRAERELTLPLICRRPRLVTCTHAEQRFWRCRRARVATTLHIPIRSPTPSTPLVHHPPPPATAPARHATPHRAAAAVATFAAPAYAPVLTAATAIICRFPPAIPQRACRAAIASYPAPLWFRWFVPTSLTANICGPPDPHNHTSRHAASTALPPYYATQPVLPPEPLDGPSRYWYSL